MEIRACIFWEPTSVAKPRVACQGWGTRCRLKRAQRLRGHKLLK